MKQFDLSNSLEILKNLKEEEYIPIIVDEKIAADLELTIGLKLSLEALFGSSLRDELEDNSIEKMFQIVKEYGLLIEKMNYIMHSIVHNVLDEKSYMYLSCPKNKLTYYYDPLLKSLIISKA